MSIKNIIRSRFIKKSKLPAWYKKRVGICNECPFSFYKNRDRTFKNYIFYILGGFKNTCTICNCPIKLKASIAEEFCSAEGIGLEPLWDVEDKISKK